ncbi:MAG: hypothetical protein F6J86_12900 [Symploca sp. SIO1B1]|nr:hypothetical protein [Symploca sp. SIO1C2]NER47758.1 hypothetical protein [Symploca sp. SIO1A3]NER94716.1 hypothetical protein [Symploca sp. SIO1B1]
MKITFRQSGGFAGLVRGCDLDTDSLNSNEAEQLETLVQQSKIMQTQSSSTPQANDLRSYQFLIEAPVGKYQVSFDDMSLPEDVRPLLKYLQNRAKPQSL